MTRTVTGTYKGEEIWAEFTAKAIPDSAGDASVPNGLMRFTTIKDAEVDRLEILGKEVAFDTLPAVVQELILALADEVDWEGEG